MSAAFYVACAVSAAGVVAALALDGRSAVGAAASKGVAGAAFVAAALLAGAWSSTPGKLLVVALVWSLVGDVALALPKGFLAGVGAFLVAHLAYCASFLARDVDAARAGVAAIPLTIAAVLVGRVLLPKVPGKLRGPVVVYIIAVSAFLALAIGVGGGTLVAGAACFWASDLLVARQRFLVKSPWNARVGLPLYVFAQLLLASTGAGA